MQATKSLALRHHESMALAIAVQVATKHDVDVTGLFLVPSPISTDQTLKRFGDYGTCYSLDCNVRVHLGNGYAVKVNFMGVERYSDSLSQHFIPTLVELWSYEGRIVATYVNPATRDPEKYDKYLKLDTFTLI